MDFVWGPTSHFSGIKTKVGTESEVKKIELSSNGLLNNNDTFRALSQGIADV